MVGVPQASSNSDRVRLPGSHAPEPDSSGLFGKDGMTFGDLVDMINPLQQLPVIGTIYRAVTGDTIKPGARLIGSAIYGGPIGMLAGGLNAMIERDHGRDMGGTMLAWLAGEDSVPKTAPDTVAPAADAPVQVAAAQAPGTEIDAEAEAEAAPGATTQAQAATPPAAVGPAAVGAPAKPQPAIGAPIPIAGPPAPARDAPVQVAAASPDAARPNVSREPANPSPQDASPRPQLVASLAKPAAQAPGFGAVPPRANITNVRLPVLTDPLAPRSAPLYRTALTTTDVAKPARSFITPAVIEAPAQTVSAPAGELAPALATRPTDPSPRRAVSADPDAGPVVPNPVPAAELPNAMLRALDKYESLLRDRDKRRSIDQSS